MRTRQLDQSLFDLSGIFLAAGNCPVLGISRASRLPKCSRNDWYEWETNGSYVRCNSFVQIILKASGVELHWLQWFYHSHMLDFCRILGSNEDKILKRIRDQGNIINQILYPTKRKKQRRINFGQCPFLLLSISQTTNICIQWPGVSPIASHFVAQHIGMAPARGHPTRQRGESPMKSPLKLSILQTK